MRWEIPGMPSEYPMAQKMRPWLIAVGCFTPALVALIYLFCSILDKYVIRLFLSTFFMCTAILSIIFILGDFANNASELVNFTNPFIGALLFYLMQMPMVLNLILPYALLLGSLWTLSKLSSSSELTGMLQSGRSLLRLISPILIGSFFIAIYFGIFGFHWAPNATLYSKLLFSSLSDSQAPDSQLVRFKNDIDNRIWNIRIPPSIDKPGAPLQDVHIEHFSAPGKLQYELFAKQATWNPNEHIWTFNNTIIRKHPEHIELLTDVPLFEDSYKNIITTDYMETPWQLISSTLRVDFLGTPEILNQLENKTGNERMRRTLRTEKHVRIARMFSCIILAFIAIPSAVTFQRKSPMKGIGIAVFLAAAMFFFYEAFPTLSSAGVIPAWLGAWLTNIIYAMIAIYLFNTQLTMRTPLEWLKERKKERLLLAKTK